MMILGVTGPTGAGKTTLLREIEARDGCVLDLDAVYHELLVTSPELIAALDHRFPGTVREGVLDRPALGKIVFADETAMKDLNAITGTYILAETERRLAAAEDAGRTLAAIDAINLLETDLVSRCRYTIAVVAPVEDRVRRIMARDGISEAYARLRISAQQPAEYFSARCDITLVNDSPDKAEFARRCSGLLEEILTLERNDAT